MSRARNNPAIEIAKYEYEGYAIVHVRAGNDGQEHITPPAGEAYSFDRTTWRHRIEIAVSPTGRSVRIHIDGEEWLPEARAAVRKREATA